MKHPREWYVLMSITIGIPLLLAVVFIGANLLLIKALYSDEDIISEGNSITFNLTSKLYSVNVSGTRIHGVPYLMNRTELDGMVLEARYRCNVTDRGNILLSNNTLEDCVRVA